MTGLEKVRRAMYLGQRSIGDYQAAERGPEVIAKRLVRRKITRSVFRLLRSVK